jgi:hypothetical protein
VTRENAARTAFLVEQDGKHDMLNTDVWFSAAVSFLVRLPEDRFLTFSGIDRNLPGEGVPLQAQLGLQFEHDRLHRHICVLDNLRYRVAPFFEKTPQDVSCGHITVTSRRRKAPGHGQRNPRPTTEWPYRCTTHSRYPKPSQVSVSATTRGLFQDLSSTPGHLRPSLHTGESLLQSLVEVSPCSWHCT